MSRVRASRPPSMPHLGRTCRSAGIPFRRSELVRAIRAQVRRGVSRPLRGRVHPRAAKEPASPDFSEARPTRVRERPAGPRPRHSSAGQVLTTLPAPRAAPPPEASALRRAVGRPAPGSPRTTALPAPRRAAQRPNSRPLSHSGVNERPLTPMLTPGPQTPSPANSWPGRDPGRRRQSRRSPGSPRFSALLRDKTAGHGLHAPSGLADPPPALGDAPGRRPEKGVLSL